jgi:hypothetical protein
LTSSVETNFDPNDSAFLIVKGIDRICPITITRLHGHAGTLMTLRMIKWTTRVGRLSRFTAPVIGKLTSRRNGNCYGKLSGAKLIHSQVTKLRKRRLIAYALFNHFAHVNLGNLPLPGHNIGTIILELPLSLPAMTKVTGVTDQNLSAIHVRMPEEQALHLTPTP